MTSSWAWLGGGNSVGVRGSKIFQYCKLLTCLTMGCHSKLWHRWHLKPNSWNKVLRWDLDFCQKKCLGYGTTNTLVSIYLQCIYLIYLSIYPLIMFFFYLHQITGPDEKLLHKDTDGLLGNKESSPHHVFPHELQKACTVSQKSQIIKISLCATVCQSPIH